MAATATRKNILAFQGPSTGRKMEYGSITFDSDATVEVPTTLNQIESVSFAESASGGSADQPSVNETFAGGAYSVPSTKSMTAEMAANSTRTFHYQFIGF